MFSRWLFYGVRPWLCFRPSETPESSVSPNLFLVFLRVPSDFTLHSGTRVATAFLYTGLFFLKSCYLYGPPPLGSLRPLVFSVVPIEVDPVRQRLTESHVKGVPPERFLPSLVGCPVLFCRPFGCFDGPALEASPSRELPRFWSEFLPCPHPAAKFRRDPKMAAFRSWGWLRFL